MGRQALNTSALAGKSLARWSSKTVTGRVCPDLDRLEAAEVEGIASASRYVLWLTRIWPGFAASCSREAVLTVSPVTE